MYTQVSLTLYTQVSLTFHTQVIYLTDLGQGAGVVELPLVLGQEHGVGVNCWWITHSSQRYIELFSITLPLNVYLQINKQVRYDASKYGNLPIIQLLLKHVAAIWNGYLKLLIFHQGTLSNLKSYQTCLAGPIYHREFTVVVWVDIYSVSELCSDIWKYRKIHHASRSLVILKPVFNS